MEELAIQQAIFFHKIINFVLIAIASSKLLASIFVRNFMKYHKIIWYITPLFLGFLSISLFSIISILAMSKFEAHISLYFIITANIAIIICETIRISKLHHARQQIILRKEYAKLVIIFYVIYVCLLYFNIYCYPM